jgi:hypothetical protein
VLSRPATVVTWTGSVPGATFRMRPVFRSPTSADTPSGSTARPHGASRQAAMMVGSVGRHGSSGVACEGCTDAPDDGATEVVGSGNALASCGCIAAGDRDA